MTDDLITRLTAAIEADEEAAREGLVHSFGCAEIQYDGTCDCGWPEKLLRWCAADRNIVAAVQRYIDGHPGPCVNVEGDEPEDYTEWDSCEMHVEWNKTTLPPYVLDILAEGREIQP